MNEYHVCTLSLRIFTTKTVIDITKRKTSRNRASAKLWNYQFWQHYDACPLCTMKNMQLTGMSKCTVLISSLQNFFSMSTRGEKILFYTFLFVFHSFATMNCLIYIFVWFFWHISCFNQQQQKSPSVRWLTLKNWSSFSLIT